MTVARGYPGRTEQVVYAQLLLLFLFGIGGGSVIRLPSWSITREPSTGIALSG